MAFNVNEIINDRYKLISHIGRGSFGEVWLASDLKTGINVAIKIYIALDTNGLEEFKNEFKSVYTLHHQNLLRSDYLDYADYNPFLIMPYCPHSAAGKVGSITEEDLRIFLRDVAAGLAYLHQQDILHRDIKPDNILIDENGNYVITDFGLSTRMRSTLRRATMRKGDNPNQAGTIAYMAPELFSTNPEPVKASDIWALGATAFELITGDVPFLGQGGAMLNYGAEMPQLPLGFSDEIKSLIYRCLAKDAWNRPTASDISTPDNHVTKV